MTPVTTRPAFLFALSILSMGYHANAEELSIPESATVVDAWSRDGNKVWSEGTSLWLVPGQAALKQQSAVIPRLCAPIRAIEWNAESDKSLKFVPDPDHWTFSWRSAPANPVIKVTFDHPPVELDELETAKPVGDGSVILHAFQASTSGEKLRFEPQWYKNTVGYWTVADDFATWQFEIEQPGTYSVALLQGCGAGQGGSDATLSIRQADTVAAELEFQTIETGHFQNFRWNHVGLLTIDEAGQFELRLQPKRIAKNALFDVRMIHLVRQAK